MISRIDHVSVAGRRHRKGCPVFLRDFRRQAWRWRDGPEHEIFLAGVFHRGPFPFRIAQSHRRGQFSGQFPEKEPLGRRASYHVRKPRTSGKPQQTWSETASRISASTIRREGWKELFIHPKDAFGVLIQLAQFDPDDYLDSSVKLGPGEKWRVEKTRDGASLKLAHPGGGNVTIDMGRSEIREFIRDLEKIVEDRRIE